MEYPPQKADEASANPLQEIRNLLMGPEQVELERLKQRMDDPALRAKEISEILPEAIKRRAERDKQLSRALEPVIKDSVQNYIKSNSYAISDSIVPVLGRTIRSYLWTKIIKGISSLNSFLLQNFSLKGLKWRVESIRSKKPFQEVVMLNTLQYRVEQVFIIHKKTGAVLQHVSEFKEEAVEEVDMFSQTLQAIQASTQYDHNVPVNSLQLGEYTVWVEQGNHLMFAGVIRGTPSFELRKVFKDTLEKIEDEQREPLENYTGNSSQFQSIKPLLMACIRVEYGKRKETLVPFWIMIGVISFCLGIWIFSSIQTQTKWQNYIKRLQSESGIVVAESKHIGNNFYITGLRDPMAADPNELLKKSGLNPKSVIGKWETYYALSPEIVIKRAKNILNAPDTVSFRVDNNYVLFISGLATKLWIDQFRKSPISIPGINAIKEEDLFDINSSELFLARLGIVLEPPQTIAMQFQDGILTLSGSAPHQWITDMSKRVKNIPGILQVDMSKVVDMDRNELAMIKERIEQHVIIFKAGINDLVQGQEKSIDILISELKELTNYLESIGNGHVEIVGHTDQSGSDQSNLAVSQKRAEFIFKLLKDRGVNTKNLIAIGVGGREPLRRENTILDREFNRSVTFKVFF